MYNFQVRFSKQDNQWYVDDEKTEMNLKRDGSPKKIDMYSIMEIENFYFPTKLDAENAVNKYLGLPQKPIPKCFLVVGNQRIEYTPGTPITFEVE